jgi:hypothetical protein
VKNVSADILDFLLLQQAKKREGKKRGRERKFRMAKEKGRDEN